MTPPRMKSFSHYAAKLGWVCPAVTAVTFLFLMLGGQNIGRRNIALIASAALCLLVVGLILSITAMLGIPRCGRRGILAPAIVGIIINGLLICFVVASFLVSRVRRAQQHGSITALRAGLALSDSQAALNPAARLYRHIEHKRRGNRAQQRHTKG